MYAVFVNETDNYNTKPILSPILRFDKRKEKEGKGTNEWKILTASRGRQRGLYIYIYICEIRSAHVVCTARSPCDLGENEISKIRYLNKAGVPRVRGKNENG